MYSPAQLFAFAVVDFVGNRGKPVHEFLNSFLGQVRQHQIDVPSNVNLRDTTRDVIVTANNARSTTDVSSLYFF